MTGAETVAAGDDVIAYRLWVTMSRHRCVRLTFLQTEQRRVAEEMLRRGLVRVRGEYLEQADGSLERWEGLA